ncbi:alkaline phosphatase, partial [Acinetobacter baumannii]
SDYNVIVDQFLALKPDVMMGGGASNFVPKSAPGSRRTDEEDYLVKFREAGYAVAATADELNAAAAKPETRKLLGLF